MKRAAKIISLCLSVAAAVLLMGCSTGSPRIATVEELGDFPRPTVRFEPRIPARALRNRISGYVLAEYVVAETGKVESVRILESEPGSLYSPGVRRAIGKWLHAPLPEKAGAVHSPPLRVIMYFCFPEDPCDFSNTPPGVEESTLHFPSRADAEKVVVDVKFPESISGLRTQTPPDKVRPNEYGTLVLSYGSQEMPFLSISVFMRGSHKNNPPADSVRQAFRHSLFRYGSTVLTDSYSRDLKCQNYPSDEISVIEADTDAGPATLVAAVVGEHAISITKVGDLEGEPETGRGDWLLSQIGWPCTPAA